MGPTSEITVGPEPRGAAPAPPRRGGWQRVAVGLLALSAGAATLVLATRLAVDARRHADAAAAAQLRIVELTAAVQEDARFAAELRRVLEEQTAASLVFNRRAERLGWALLAAAAACVGATKGYLGLRRRGLPVPPPLVQLQVRVAQRHAAGAAPRMAAAPDVRLTAAAQGPPDAGDSADLDVALAEVDAIIDRCGSAPAAVLPILHALQARFRYVPEAALRRVCQRTRITPAQIAAVVSFYPQFRRSPLGAHHVRVCVGTACHAAGSDRVAAELGRRLGIPAGRDTDPQRRYTVEPVPCLGCCTLAPVVQIDGVTHGRVQPDGLTTLLTAGADGARRAAPRPEPGTAAAGARPIEVRVGLGSCCVANGSGAVYDALCAAVARHGAPAVLKRVGCVGMCHQTPFVEIVRAGQEPVIFTRVTPDQAVAIARRYLARHPVARFVGALRAAVGPRRGRARAAAPAPRACTPRDPQLAAFLGRQVHIATEHAGRLDPLDFDEYVRHDGFVALARCRTEYSPLEIIERVERSGLRGRGGAGFPTGTKWRLGHDAAGPRKFVICNGDEGDPGAFMDRMLMESYPYRVIEGLAIAARAVGAAEGVFYIRAEYPLACARIETALRTCVARGVLHDSPAGATPARPYFRVAHGAGAFVCGEETALIAALQGRRGTPVLRPPYPVERGLEGCPTLVNNVETLACIPWIIRRGPEAFAAIGTPRSRGTKVFALAGKIARGGLIEVPMGMTLREIIADIGGGVRPEATAAGPRPRRLKAVQIGGPSGGCVPAALVDTPVDFDALAEVGALMGSGGLVVLDDRDCLVDMARYFVSFTQSQSCGRCVPCRIGTQRMLDILDRITAGRGRPADLAELERLAGHVGLGSLCGLGRTAPNPVLTTLRYFRFEYEAHLAGRCPAGRCAALVDYVVTDRCTGCTLCAQHCPADAILPRPYERHAIDTDRCTRCDGCRVRCPEGAIEIVSPRVGRAARTPRPAAAEHEEPACRA